MQVEDLFKLKWQLHVPS